MGVYKVAGFMARYLSVCIRTYRTTIATTITSTNPTHNHESLDDKSGAPEG